MRFQFVVIVQQYAHALLVGKPVHQIRDHAARLLVVERLVRDALFVGVLKVGKRVLAVLVHGQQKFTIDLTKTVFAQICRDALHPADVCLRIGQRAELLIDGDQYFLRRVLRRLLVAQHLQTIVIHHILHVGKDAVHRLSVAVLSRPHVRGDRRECPFFAHDSLSLCCYYTPNRSVCNAFRLTAQRSAPASFRCSADRARPDGTD